MHDSIARSFSPGEIHLHWIARPPGSGRQQLKKVLAPYLGVAWQTVGICQVDASSKPFLTDAGDIRFNWSHSAEWALVAVGHGLEVGVDLESRNRAVRALALAKRFFADSEFRFLCDLPETQRATAFFRLWTGKEAVLKALGRGISDGLDRVELTVSASGDLQIQRLGLENLPGDPVHLLSLHIPVDPVGHACAALAWCGQRCRIRSFYHGQSTSEPATTTASWCPPSGIRA